MTEVQQSPAIRTRLASAWHEVLDALLTTDWQQRHRLTMCGLASMLMLCGILTMQILSRAGLADPRLVGPWAMLSVAGMAVIFGLIRSGFALRFADPSLTGPQILYGITCTAMAFVILAVPARGLALPMLAIIVMFGMFGLTARQMLGVMCYALSLFALAILSVDWRGYYGQRPNLSASYAFIVAVLLMGSTFLTQRMQRKRNRLRRQRQELALALEQIRQQATHDELTGLPNRRHMVDLMRHELLRAKRGKRQPLLAQLDVDHFKVVNDTYGHAVGDLALQSFVRTARDALRQSDILSRWGGEEFVLMLCDTTRPEAEALLEQLRLQVAEPRTVRPELPALRVTVSMGVACVGADERLEAALERADFALYAAKAGGRDRVVWAD
ncbi:GGDEF domain-containing protein [Paracidovorax wautersii]|uniref:GGDEF domain-containing protein n=1 Tax=Paracidovorax wautersii TaxID=1177982 RepID=UPI0031D0E162